MAFPTVSKVTAKPFATKRSSGQTALLVKVAFSKSLDTRADAQMRCKTLAMGMLGEKGKKPAVTAAMMFVKMPQQRFFKTQKTAPWHDPGEVNDVPNTRSAPERHRSRLLSPSEASQLGVRDQRDQPRGPRPKNTIDGMSSHKNRIAKKSVVPLEHQRPGL